MGLKNSYMCEVFLVTNMRSLAYQKKNRKKAKGLNNLFCYHRLNNIFIFPLTSHK
jgi:hypothetical protein